jgi:hypothetical protein
VAPTLTSPSPYLLTQVSNLTTLTTAAFTPADNEVLVVKVATENTNQPVIGTVSGGSLTYASRAASNTASHCQCAIYTAAVGTSPGSMTVSCTFTTTTGFHSMLVERWSGAALAGTPATVATTQVAGTAPSATVTTTGTNSVVSWVVADWAATSPATRAYRSSAVEEGIHDASSTGNYVAYYAYQAAAAAGAQTIGLTAPNQTPTLCGVEIQSSGGAAATVAPTQTFNRVPINRASMW